MGRRSAPSSPLAAHGAAGNGSAGTTALPGQLPSGGLGPQQRRPTEAEILASLGGALAHGLPASAAAAGHSNF
jgi:hypothetical protein